MQYEDIYLVSHKRAQLSEAELANLKCCQDYTFPDDLCEFLREFGAGEYCGCFYIFKPVGIAEKHLGSRTRRS